MVVVATLVGPGPASAAHAPGVHIDPGSPAGREYAIPLGQARSTGAPARATRADSAQLFGVGISPSKPGPTPDPAPAAAIRSAHRTAPPPAAVKPEAVAITPVRKLLDGGGGQSSGAWWMLAAGALVLVLGGLGGAVLARRS